MTQVVQQWLAGLIGLGALYLVVTNGAGLGKALQAGQQFVSGTESTAITGKA